MVYLLLADACVFSTNLGMRVRVCWSIGEKQIFSHPKRLREAYLEYGTPTTKDVL